MKYRLVPTKQKKPTIKEYLASLSNEKLLELYNQTKTWLIKHEAKSGTQNRVDVSDQAYNPDKYESKLRLLERTEDEGREREITPFISDKTIEGIFGAPIKKHD